ncbi:S66 family peptidase [Virgibacillus alimentarius]|uniref:Muramoyltetrapeptide carboxypeptidase LdcA involved in peptidoglycan recycling n=1 Tax=Virgibacillus alimentarius TaxID=698769 RepID=A0ABS4SB07_9BACI|nr:S66 peptidase family protein [Virgibacillus alimentarius]MBP2258685.1 muramoyltetrapeptide carboxypeptidase LdcA involved in peptidoglycan recycling [Virgibacillus alimentarius]
MSQNINYPKPLKQGDKIAITAPSSGVKKDFHPLVSLAKKNLEQLGFFVEIGNTVWNGENITSCKKEIRAQELTKFLLDDNINAIIPPWGGELLMEVLPLLDWKKIRRSEPKWILGYSDISTLNFAYTLLTGNATAHGTNFIDLSSESWDPVTASWIKVLNTSYRETVVQKSSRKYQSSWDNAFQNKDGFFLDKPTEWKVFKGEKATMSGHLLGGCQNTLTNLIGTPFAPVEKFIYNYLTEGVIWYFESIGWDAAEIYRSLWQMKQNNWFKNTNGILLGRPSNYSSIKEFDMEGIIEEVFGDLNIPVIYDVDIGHKPPQLTLVNGVWGEVSSIKGKGMVTMTFQ